MGCQVTLSAVESETRRAGDCRCSGITRGEWVVCASVSSAQPKTQRSMTMTASSKANLMGLPPKEWKKSTAWPRASPIALLLFLRNRGRRSRTLLLQRLADVRRMGTRALRRVASARTADRRNRGRPGRRAAVSSRALELRRGRGLPGAERVGQVCLVQRRSVAVRPAVATGTVAHGDRNNHRLRLRGRLLVVIVRKKRMHPIVRRKADGTTHNDK